MFLAALIQPSFQASQAQGGQCGFLNFCGTVTKDGVTSHVKARPFLRVIPGLRRGAGGRQSWAVPSLIEG